MQTFLAGEYDIAVIGAGHAGIEAALAAARLGRRTICFTINLDAVGNMPCNPAIGGTGKGHLVRELDALGGEMAKAADAACIQYRMLNRGKGPAVHSLRAQADRRRYQEIMKHALELQENLTLRQGEVVDIGLTEGRGDLRGHQQVHVGHREGDHVGIGDTGPLHGDPFGGPHMEPGAQGGKVIGGHGKQTSCSLFGEKPRAAGWPPLARRYGRGITRRR